MKRLVIVCAAAVILSVIASPSAFATAYNLTTAGAVANDAGVFYVQIDPQSTGTGVIDSFVEIAPTGNAPTGQAYNTTVNGVFDNGSSDNFNHSITLGQVPVVVNPGGGVAPGSYYQFLLDINENNNAALDQYLSLDSVIIYVNGTPNSNSTNLASGGPLGTIAYSLDGGGVDDWVALNYALNTGSGSGDMFLYVPIATLGANPNTVITLYSQFGLQGVLVAPIGAIPAGNYGNSDGFEEWAVLVGPPTQVPEPASLSLILAGLGVLGTSVWLKRKD